MLSKHNCCCCYDRWFFRSWFPSLNLSCCTSFARSIKSDFSLSLAFDSALLLRPFLHSPSYGLRSADWYFILSFFPPPIIYFSYNFFFSSSFVLNTLFCKNVHRIDDLQWSLDYSHFTVTWIVYMNVVSVDFESFDSKRSNGNRTRKCMANSMACMCLPLWSASQRVLFISFEMNLTRLHFQHTLCTQLEVIHDSGHVHIRWWFSMSIWSCFHFNIAALNSQIQNMLTFRSNYGMSMNANVSIVVQKVFKQLQLSIGPRVMGKSFMFHSFE